MQMTNEELQTAINDAIQGVILYKTGDLIQDHLKVLLEIQRERACAVNYRDITGDSVPTEAHTGVPTEAHIKYPSGADDNDPPWIKWGGLTNECPTPHGHDVEVMFKDGDKSRDKCPEGWSWDSGLGAEKTIVAYRDWTEWRGSDNSGEWINVEDDLPDNLAVVLGLTDKNCVVVVTYDARVQEFVQDTTQAELYNAEPLGKLNGNIYMWKYIT